MCALGLLVGCTFDVSVETTPQPGPRTDAAVERVDAGETDAMAEPAADAASGERPRIRHRECIVTPAEELPDPPVTRTDARGRPYFDTWRDYDCAELAGAALSGCGRGSSSEDPGCSSCLFLSDGSEQGVCSGLVDASTPPVVFRDRACIAHATSSVHALACCTGVPGVDCDAWPYPANRERGDLCGVHEDCEPGLVCRAPTPDSTYGRCVCPNETPAMLPSASDCEELNPWV